MNMDEEQKFDEVLESNEQKQEAIMPQPIKVNGNKGKPKSEAWRIAQSERMRKIHAEKKAKITQTA